MARARTLSVTIDLDESDIAYFRERLQRARQKAASSADPSTIIGGAEALMAEALKKALPAFVRQRIEKLGPLISMLKDQDWRLEGEDRARVLDSLAYFVEPDDLIPDRIPGIGYLDDAIMIELVSGELEPEIEAYEKFCEARSRIAGKPVPAPSPIGEPVETVVMTDAAAARLAKEREELQARMRRRARRRGGGGGGGGMHSPFALF